MSPQIQSVAIANRGEVAVRIIRACQELGLKTILLHSEADRKTMAYRMADVTQCLGDSPSSESYLHIDRNIQSALAAGADAVHPGFGFLSENADFAQACENHGMVFVGPSPESIRLFGDKISAKTLAEKAGLPTIPGYQGEDQSLSRLISEAEKMGFPVIVKAAAGGGGRGLKVIQSRAEAEEMIQSAQREGQSAFGSSVVFLEKYLGNAKHIEVQIFGDASGKVHHLYERECSIQRRHQKIIEEAPSADLDPDLRRRILGAAVKLAEVARYRSAGTVEFLVQDNEFYFMEMNTRLQVEHPVTEMITGRDLVKAQLLTAMGRNLFWGEARAEGHAIECRIYAEDPYQGGIPSTGKIAATSWPYGPGRRFEVGFEAGDEVSSFYDSMIAKVVVHDETRVRALLKLKRVLDDCMIFGVRTNIPLLKKIIEHPDVVSGAMTTRFFGQHFSTPLEKQEITASLERVVAQLRTHFNRPEGSRGEGIAFIPNPWLENWGQG